MTPAQFRLLTFIENFQRDHAGLSPSFSEMVKGMGRKSKGGLWNVLNKLEGTGRIKRKHYARRAIEIVQ